MGRHGVRSDWQHVPDSIRVAVDELLGAEVVATRSLVGGFSPGPAVRAELDDGRTVFIKAAGTSLNADSPAMHRREGVVLRSLPRSVPAPTLIGTVDDGDWVALVVEWIDGRTPTATNGRDVQRMLALLGRVAEDTQGLRIDRVESVAATHADLFRHWAQLADDPPSGLDDWSRRHLSTLTRVEADVWEATAGEHLVHLDVRTDNVLLAASGASDDVLVDWPGASIGAPWVDLAVLLPALRLDGGPPPHEMFATTPLGQAADPDAVDVLVVTLAGYFTRNSLLPAPPGLPTLRAFQAAQGQIARAWAADRLGLDRPASAVHPTLVVPVGEQARQR